MRWLSVFWCTIGLSASCTARSMGDGRADHAGGVAEEERDRLGRRELGRHDEVALVLAVLVVDHDDDLSAADGRDRFLDLRQRHVTQPSIAGAARRTWR